MRAISSDKCHISLMPWCLLLVTAAQGCIAGGAVEPYIPAMRYARDGGVGREGGGTHGDARTSYPAAHATAARREQRNEGPHAQLRFVSEGRPPLGPEHAAAVPRLRPVAAETDELAAAGVHVERADSAVSRPYSGPLALGDPGVTASLWRESRAGNDIFRDFRAWQPMDLITIVVTERSRGMHDADTEVKSTSQVLAAIQNFLGLEEQTAQWNHPPNLSSLVRAQTQNNYKGEGLTNRQAELTARISAVVAEVLPSGLLRVEGEKIISVNNEEQVMVISGLVRQRDINSLNEVDSSKVAQMRIDYYGKGTVGEAQRGGWVARLMRYLWPF